MTYTEKRLADFDIAFPEGGTSGWIGDPSYPADLCCGADYCSHNCDEKKREAIKAFLTSKIAQALAEERERVRGEIEVMKNIPHLCESGEGYKCEYAEALDDLLSSLDKQLPDNNKNI